MAANAPNIEIEHYTPGNPPSTQKQEALVDFLHKHLDEYGDQKEHIRACLDYALGRNGGPGGDAFMGFMKGDLLSCSIINKTGMKGYIPENILVYIAVNRKARGSGIGKAMMDKILQEVQGDIALHVEHNNPARFLYEKYGFTNPYLEMRLKRSQK